MKNSTQQLVDDSNFPFLAKYKNFHYGTVFQFVLASIGFVGGIISIFSPVGDLLKTILICSFGVIGGLSLVLTEVQHKVIRKYYSLTMNNDEIEQWVNKTYNEWEKQKQRRLLNFVSPKTSPFKIVDDSDFPFVMKYKNLFILPLSLHIISIIFIGFGLTSFFMGMVPHPAVSIGFVILSLVILGISLAIDDKQQLSVKKFYPNQNWSALNRFDKHERLIQMRNFWKDAVAETELLYSIELKNRNDKRLENIPAGPPGYFLAASGNWVPHPDLVTSKFSKRRIQPSLSVPSKYRTYNRAMLSAPTQEDTLPQKAKELLAATFTQLAKASGDNNTVEAEHFIETSQQVYIPDLLNLYYNLPEKVKHENSEETSLFMKRLTEIKAKADKIIALAEDEQIKEFKVYNEFLEEAIEQL